MHQYKGKFQQLVKMGEVLRTVLWFVRVVERLQIFTTTKHTSLPSHLERIGVLYFVSINLLDPVLFLVLGQHSFNFLRFLGDFLGRSCPLTSWREGPGSGGVLDHLGED